MHLSIFNSNLGKVSKTIFMILLLTYTLDSIVYTIFSTIQKNVYTGQMGGKINFLINYLPPQDVVVVGSSKALHHVDTDKWDKAYNVGHDGGKIGLSLGILELLIANQKQPRLILLHTDPSEYFKSFPGSIYNGNDISQISTFIGKSETVKWYYHQDKTNYLMINMFKSYVYNAKVFSLIKNFTKAMLIKPKNLNSGFEPLQVSNMEVEKFSAHINSFKTDNKAARECISDTLAIQLLQKFISKCGNNNIELVCFNSPEYIKLEQCERSFANLLDSLKIRYYDYNNDSIRSNLLRDYGYWKDNAHLSIKGAEALTEIIKNDIF